MVEKRSINDVVFNIFNYTFFILFTIICVFPFYYLFINTISDQGLVSKGLINFYPRGINIKNYIALRNVHDLGSSFIVTLARTIIGTARMPQNDFNGCLQRPSMERSVFRSKTKRNSLPPKPSRRG